MDKKSSNKYYLKKIINSKYFNMTIYKIIIIILIFCLNYSNRKIINKREKAINSHKTKNPYYSKDLNGKLLFMRHGQTNFNNDKDTIARRTNINYVDCRLNSRGIIQAKTKQEILNHLCLEKVYVSPFYRALQTLTYSLENHPNKDKIIAVVHPFVSEITNCINDYILDIKQTKKDFNLNSTIKIDWSLFDEYIKNIKYDENFYYFDNFDCFNENEKKNKYLELKNYYDNGEIEKLKNGLSELATLRFNGPYRFESLKHAQGRFKKFLKYIRKKHKNTLENTEEKIFVFSHSSFMTVATNMTPYESETVQNFNYRCYSPKNCQILSYNIYS